MSISSSAQDSNLRRLIIIGGFFFLFGFITWVNGSLIPYLTIACELAPWQAYLVTFAFYISYTVMAFPSSWLLKYTGMIKGMQVGLLIMALGCLLFIPAAIARLYILFLLGLFVLGIGLTLLQTAVNPYITVLGSLNKAAQRISIMGICNKFAGMLAPLILGAVILRNSDGLVESLLRMDAAAKNEKLNMLARSVILPYGILTIILASVALLMKYAHLPEIAPSADPGQPAGNAGKNEKHLPLWLSFLAIFGAVGAEVIAGDTIANYGLYNGIPLSMAKNLTSFTLAGMIAGYVLGAFSIPKMLSQEKAFFYSAVSGIFITILIMLSSGIMSVALVALLGFANALLWPAIWPQALRGRTGSRLHSGSAVLIMGIAGGALMPLLYGLTATALNPRRAYAVLIPCYLYNIAYWNIGRLRNLSLLVVFLISGYGYWQIAPNAKVYSYLFYAIRFSGSKELITY